MHLIGRDFSPGTHPNRIAVGFSPCDMPSCIRGACNPAPPTLVRIFKPN
jgi:hypothetical protein